MCCVHHQLHKHEHCEFRISRALFVSAPYLSGQSLDKSLFESEKKSGPGSQQQTSQLKPEPSPAPPPSPASQSGPATPNPNSDDRGSQISWPYSSGKCLIFHLLRWFRQMQCNVSCLIFKGEEGSAQKETQDQIPEVDCDSTSCPSIVIYLVDPFTYAHNQWPQFTRLAVLGLLRCYQEMLSKLPEPMRHHVHPQVCHFSSFG